MNEQPILAQPQTLYMDSQRKISPHVKLALGVSSSVLEPPRSLFVLHPQTPSLWGLSTSKALSPELPTREGGWRLCCKNRLGLWKIASRHGDVRHHLPGCSCHPLATAPTSLSPITLPASLVTSAPGSSIPLTPPPSVCSFPGELEPHGGGAQAVCLLDCRWTLSTNSGFNPAKLTVW